MPGNDLYSTDCRVECQSERNVAAMGAGLVCDIRICLDLWAGPDLRCAHLIRIGGKRGESGRGDFFSALLSRSSQKMGEHDPDTPDLSADCIMPAFGL